MQLQRDIKTHPLYAYAQYAVYVTRRRFPEGAGNRIDGPPQATVPEILVVFNKLCHL